LIKYTLLTLSFSFIFIINNAQEFSTSGINLGLKIGGSRLLGEFPKGFSGVINEFDNKNGFASAFEISKYIAPKWEIGADVSFSVLNGNSYTPEFSAEGIQPGIPKEINDPVEYKNKLLGFNFFFRYFFKTAGAVSIFNPFIRAGGGYLNYYSIFKYIDAAEDDLIFGKGTEGFTQLSTPVFFAGAGFKTYFSSNFYLVTSIDFNMVKYDFLDVMHNYSNEGNRIDITGLYTEFKVGFFYNIASSGGNKNKNGNNKKGGSSNGSHLPFAR
jgi:hypothetical protein